MLSCQFKYLFLFLILVHYCYLYISLNKTRIDNLSFFLFTKEKKKDTFFSSNQDFEALFIFAQDKYLFEQWATPPILI